MQKQALAWVAVTTLNFGLFNNIYSEEVSPMPSTRPTIVQPTTRQDIQKVFDKNMAHRSQWLKDYFQGLPVEMGQFDFILGEWKTSLAAYDLDGKVLQQSEGRWRAKNIDGGRIVMDEYESLLPNGQVLHGGTTLRTFSPVTQQWEMVFLNSLQANLVSKFIAKFNQGEIHGEAYGTDLDGIETLAKIRFYNISANSFDWEQEMSWDGGKIWFRTLSIQAVRTEAL